MALSNYGPPYLRSPACRVLFAGWESTTLALQHAGWRLAAEQDVEWGRLRLMMRFEPAKLTVVCEDVNHRFSMRGWGDRDDLPVFVARYATSDLKVVEPMDPSAFFAIDATPHIVYEPPKSIDDFKLFATAQTRTEEIIVEPQSVAECLDLIKKLQAPELAAIRERNRKREMRERMPAETFHAQIISIAA